MRRSLLLAVLITSTVDMAALAQPADVAGARYAARAAEAERSFGRVFHQGAVSPATNRSAIHRNSGAAQAANQADRYREPNPFQVRNTTNPFQLQNTTNPFQQRNTTNPLQLRNTDNPLQQHR